MQFMVIQYLQDVLSSFAKKIVINLNIADLQPSLIERLYELFKLNKGDHSVSFEVMEIEVVNKIVAEVEAELFNTSESDLDLVDPEPINDESIVIPDLEAQEENRIITRLTMPSRKLRVNISAELLEELEKMQLNFKLN